MEGQRSPQELDALLARGRLSGARRERILAAVLQTADVKPPRERRRWTLVWGSMAAVGAAAALLLVVSRNGSIGWRAKGKSSDRVVPSFEVGCVDGGIARCRRGGTLVFRIDGAAEGGFLAAYARPLDDPRGERIWYFPTTDGQAPKVEPRDDPQTLKQGVRLGPEQPPGRYELHFLLGRRPLSRQEVIAATRSADLITTATTLLEITP